MRVLSEGGIQESTVLQRKHFGEGEIQKRGIREQYTREEVFWREGIREGDIRERVYQRGGDRKEMFQRGRY